MNNSTEIIRNIDDAIELLSRPLSTADAEKGWTDGVRLNWYHGLKSLRDDLIRNPHGDYSRINTAKALGTDGIYQGSLAELIAHIGTLLRNI